MPEKKMLVYGRDGSGRTDGKVRKTTRVLAYSSLLLPLISCGGAPQHAQEPTVDGGERIVQQEDPDCRMDGGTLVYRENGTERKRTGVLELGEHALAVACPFNDVTVLTDRSLVIIYGNGPEGTDGSVSVSLDSTRTDMRGILEPGFVDWAQSEDTVYVLTMDDRMTLIPKADMGDTIAAYPTRFEVRAGDDLSYFGGFEFIAGGDGTLAVLEADQEGASRNMLVLPSRVAGPDSDFFTAGGRLYYGRPDGERVEIIIGGPDVHDVRLGQ